MINLRTVKATRYVTPLREGGSLPAIIEADDDGLYVLKFRGAGQGIKALIAEVIAGEIARFLGLRIPEIVYVDLDAVLARTEPDPEIQDLIKASGGLNLALDYLPGSITFDPLIEKPDGTLASSIVWLDAFTANVDRTPRNANMLLWHKNLWLIDHGAALFYHHNWDVFLGNSRNPFRQIKDHILLPYADKIAEIDDEFSRKLTPNVLRNIVGLIPDDWLDEPDAQRGVYFEFLTNRLAAPRDFVKEAIDARTLHVDYATIRFVPRVEREEFMNVGVILSCPAQKFLEARIEIQAERLKAFAPSIEPETIQLYLDTIPRICVGGKDAGTIGRMLPRERFYWLTAQRSTIIQCSPVHTGLCTNAPAMLEHLLDMMVR